MISADNLNLDVLELIFAYLSGHDLTSIGLVSRSFLAGVVPILYRSIVYRLREAKAYDSILSPFAVLLANRGLAKHVRTIDIQSIPKTRNLKIRSQPHTVFMSDCRKAIELCVSLHTFKCTESSVIPAFLKALQDKANLHNLRIYGNLTNEQLKLVLNINALSELFLEYASWNVVNALPSWTGGMQNTLTSVVLYRSGDLNEASLELLLKELPDLRGLHVIQCPQVDQVLLLNLLTHTPTLESLSFTTMEKSRTLGTSIPPLPCLQHLALDARYNMTPSPTPAILLSLLNLLRASAPNILSFSLKLPERKIVISPSFIDRLTDVYGGHIQKVSFLDCSLDLESISKIGQGCPLLERLDVSIPMRDVYGFANLLAPAKFLTTIVDVDAHSQHGIRPSLNLEMVEYMMESIPSLKTVVSDNRVWVADDRDEYEGVSVRLDRRLPLRNRPSWFLPSTLS